MNEVVGKATVQITPDLSTFSEDLKAKLAEAMQGSDQQTHAKEDIEVDVTGDATEKLPLIATEAKTVGGMKEDIHVGVTGGTEAHSSLEKTASDVESVGKAAESAGGNTNNLSDSLKKAGDSAASAGEGIGGIMVPAILALAPLITPLAAVTAGFGVALAGVGTAAAGGLGGFAIAAFPVVKQVMTAMQQITADQEALKRATTPASQATALTHLKDDIAGLPPGVADLVAQLKQVTNTFDQWDQQFQKPVLDVLSKGIALIIPLLQDMTPLVMAGATALSQMFDTLGSALQAQDFKDFIGWMAREAPAALNSIVVGFTNFMAAISKMMEGFTPYMHIIEAGWINLTAAMEKFSTSTAFHDFVQYVIASAPEVGKVLKDAFGAIGSLLIGLAPAGAVALKVLDNLFTIIKEIAQSTGFKDSMVALEVVLLTVTHAIDSLNTKTHGLSSDLLGIGVVAFGIFSVMGLVGKGLKGLEEGFGHGIGHMKQVWHFFADDVDSKGANIRKVFSGIGDAFESMGNRMKSIGNGLVSAFNWVKNLVTGSSAAEAAQLKVQASMEETAAVATETSTAIQGTFDEAMVSYEASLGQLSLFSEETEASFVGMGAAAETEAATTVEAQTGVMAAFRARMAAMLRLNEMTDEGFISMEAFGGGEAVLAGETGALAVSMDAEAASADAAAVSTGIFSGVIDTLTAAFAALDISTGGILLAIGALVVGAIYVATHWKQVWGEVVRVYHDVVGFVKKYSTEIAAGLVILLGPLGLVLAGALELALHWKAVWHDILVVVDDAVNWLKSHLLLTALFAPWLAAIVFVAEHWRLFWAAIKLEAQIGWQVLQDIFKLFMDGVHLLWWTVQQDWNLILDVFVGIPRKIISFFSDAGTWLVQAGKDIIGGLIHGLITAPLHGIEEVGKKIIGGFRTALSWFSPPAWTVQAGTDIMGGFDKGITTGSQNTVNTAKKVSQQIIDAFGSLDQIKTDAGAVGGLKAIFDNLNGVFNSIAGAEGNAQSASSALGSISTAVTKMNGVINQLSNMPDTSGVADKVKNATKALSDLGDAFKSIGTDATRSPLVTGDAIQHIIDSTQILKVGLKWIAAGIEGVDKDLHEAKSPVDTTNWAAKFFDAVGKLFTAFSHPGANWTLVTPDAMRDVVASVFILREGIVWIDAGIAALGGTLEHNADHPIHTMQWAEKYFDAVDKLFKAFGKAGADWPLVTADAMRDVVGSIYALRQGIVWIDAGVAAVGGTLEHNADHPIQTMAWATKYFDAVDKLFKAFSHPGADWTLVTPDAVKDVVGAVYELRVGAVWIDAGIAALGGTLQHNAQHPIETLAWADKFFTAVDKLFKAFSHPGADWTLVSEGATKGVIGSVANLTTATAYITAGVKQIGASLNAAAAPVDTLNWLGKVFDAMHDLFVKAANAAASGALVTTSGLARVTLAIANIVLAMNQLPAAIKLASGPAMDTMKSTTTAMTDLLASIADQWHTTWTGLPKPVKDMWTGTQPTMKKISTDGLTPLENDITHLGTVWGDTFSGMTKATTDMWTAIAPILTKMDAALVTTAADFLTVGSVSTPVATSAIGSGVSSGGGGGGGGVTVEAAITPTIIINGSNLSQSDLKNAVSEAMNQSNQELIALINAHTP